MNIPIIFEDEWLMVLDKPAGLLSVPAPGKDGRTLTGILNQDAQEKNLGYRLYPCHRLDRDTSGLVIYAKSKLVEEKMAQAFAQRQVHKTYIAFVQGKLAGQGEIKKPLEQKAALTRYKALQVKNNYTLVEVAPVTGRTNQIRIHFKYIGHPLVGEDKFAFRKDFALKAKRVLLHARRLEFKHPLTQKILRLEAPIPADMQKFVELHP